MALYLNHQSCQFTAGYTLSHSYQNSNMWYTSGGFTSEMNDTYVCEIRWHGTDTLFKASKCKAGATIVRLLVDLHLLRLWLLDPPRPLDLSKHIEAVSHLGYKKQLKKCIVLDIQIKPTPVLEYFTCVSTAIQLWRPYPSRCQEARPPRCSCPWALIRWALWPQSEDRFVAAISVGLFMGELPTNTGLSKSSGWGPSNFCDTLRMINMYIWFHHNRIICILYSNYIYIYILHYITFEVLSLMCMQRAHRTPIELRQFLQVEILLSFYLEIIKVWQSHFLFTMYSLFVAHHARGRAFNNHKRCLIQAEFLTIQLPWLVAFSGNCKELSINSRFTL